MIIRREDFGDIEKLTKGSHKKIWFSCEKCGKPVLQSYRNYVKQKGGHFCRSCRNSHTASLVKYRVSQKSKERWKDPNYRKKMSKLLSASCKKSWDNDDGTRKKNLSINNPMKKTSIRDKVSRNGRVKEEELIKICEEHNYKYIGRKMKKEGTIVIFQCDKGHIQEKRLDSFRKGSWRCAKCCESFSGAEKEIASYIKFLDINVLENVKNIILPHEIDIVIPDRKIAIEYNGLYWHSEEKGKYMDYHIDKLNACTDKGYRLITIFEDEWVHKQKIVQKRLKYILGLETRRIHARKCTIKEIGVQEARDFINANHIQGYSGSRIKLGAFYEGELVAVMTFSRPSISKGGRNEQDVWELNRFATVSNIIGIPNRMLRHFEKHYDSGTIISYCDKRWNTGKVYEKMGFIRISDTKPNYWYVDLNERYRIHRFNLRSKNGITEKEQYKRSGYYKIWDCGSMKYKKTLD